MLLPRQAIHRGLVADSAEHNTLHIERVFIHFFQGYHPVLRYALFMMVNFHYSLYKIIILKREPMEKYPTHHETLSTYYPKCPAKENQSKGQCRF